MLSLTPLLSSSKKLEFQLTPGYGRVPSVNISQRVTTKNLIYKYLLFTFQVKNVNSPYKADSTSIRPDIGFHWKFHIFQCFVGHPLPRKFTLQRKRHQFVVFSHDIWSISNELLIDIRHLLMTSRNWNNLVFDEIIQNPQSSPPVLEWVIHFLMPSLHELSFQKDIWFDW